MSIYDNKTKIYPDLNPTAPQEPQTYQLQKLTEIEAYLLNELEVRERRAKKPKRFNTITGISLILSLATGITRKYFKTFTVKQERHDAIKLIAQRKLDSITDIISWAMQDGNISPTEFYKVLQEVEKYHKLKADIRNQAKAKVKQITKEQREEILEQGRKEGKEIFFTAICKHFTYPGCQCHLKYEFPPPYGM